MKKLILFILLSFSVLVLFRYCRFTVFPKLDARIFSVVKPKDQIPTPTTKEECVQQGGEWRKPGPWPKEVCMMPNKDGDKSCIAGFQCSSGHCLSYVKNLRYPETFAVGRCPRYRIFFGCLQEVHFGLTSSWICLD